MMDKKKVLITLVFFILVVVSVSFSEKGTYGIIRECEYVSELCNDCYCLETKDGVCLMIDYSEVGDLSALKDKKVEYKAANSTKYSEYCPTHIKLFEIKRIFAD